MRLVVVNATYRDFPLRYPQATEKMRCGGGVVRWHSHHEIIRDVTMRESSLLRACLPAEAIPLLQTIKGGDSISRKQDCSHTIPPIALQGGKPRLSSHQLHQRFDLVNTVEKNTAVRKPSWRDCKALRSCSYASFLLQQYRDLT